MPRTPLSRKAAIASFFSRFDRSGGRDACHPWTGSTDNGYGQVKIDALGGKNRSHVLAWELTYGEVPRHPETGRKLDLDHECHNRDEACPGGKECPHRRCGNLRHIVVKTTQDNKDAADAPRKRGKFRTHFDCGCEITEANTYLITRKGTRNGKPRPPERRCRLHERRKQRDRKPVLVTSWRDIR